MNQSKHATIRAQQRGISDAVIEILEAFAPRHHDHHGAVRLLLCKRARARIDRALGRSGAQLKLRSVYAVLDAHDDTLITVGHRTRRFAH